MMNTEKIKAVKSIVNSYLDINVDNFNRKEATIQGRAICYKILRDECGLTLSFIGKNFNKNHATILHALKEFPYMLKFNKQLEKDFIEILALWEAEADEYTELDPLKLKKELQNLREQNKMLNLSLINVQEQLVKQQNRIKKYRSLVNLVDARVPEQRLHEVEHKLNQLINGL
jgi:hypothetical protein